MKTVTVHKPGGMKGEDFSVSVMGTETAEMFTELDSEVEVIFDGKRLARGNVVSAWGGPVSNVPACLVEKHHDPVCRSYSGLTLVHACLLGRDMAPDEAISILYIRPLPESKLEVVSGMDRLRGRRNRP